jgi:hypothetical protein
MPVVADYPTHGWRFWAFMAVVVTLGLVGVVLMLAVTGGMSS